MEKSIEGVRHTAEQVYTVTDLAKRLGVGRVGLYSAIRRHEVPHVRIGRRIVLPREAVDRWLGCAHVDDARGTER